MHQDESERGNLGQVTAHLLLANGHVTVAKEKVDRAVNLRLQAGLVAQINHVAKFRSCDLLLRRSENLGIKFAAYDPPEAVHPQRLSDHQRADAQESSGLHDQLWLDC